MAIPAILINQATLPPGTSGVSRKDLVVGQIVTLVDTANVSGPYLWELVVPPGSASFLSGAFTSSASFTPDIPGTYLVYHTSGTDQSWIENAIGDRFTVQGGCAIILGNGTRSLGLGETIQFSQDRGWTEDFDPIFSDFDQLRKMLQDPAGTLWFGSSSNEVGSLPPSNAGRLLRTNGVGLPPSWADVDVIPESRQLTAGAGLTGGGDLSANRVFDVVANADGSMVVNPDDIQVGVLATDAQHGVRGGGAQHALAVPSGDAGFMSGADKDKLDSISAGAQVNEVHRQEALVSQVITGTDTPISDTLDATPISNSSVKLFLNGVLQEQGATKEYTISGTTITWLALTGTAVDLDTSDSLLVEYSSAS